VTKKICILPPQLGLGGPASFQAGLIQAFTARGVAVTHDLHEDEIDAILVFGGAPQISSLFAAQKRGVRLVQRLNGMNWIHRQKFTGVRHFLKAEYGNLKLLRIRQRADGVIYQSEFARSWWQREKGAQPGPSVVIHNGVDLALFTPQPSNLPADRYRVLMVEAHHGGGYEQGLLSAASLISELNRSLDKPCELWVAGEVPLSLRAQSEAICSKIRWLGVVKHTEIPAIDRSAHLFFSGDLNASCPNAAIEALACGLPVISFDTGAMKELIPENAGRIVPYGANVWKLEKPEVSGLVDAARMVFLQWPGFHTGARKQAEECFDIRSVAERYLDFLFSKS